MCMFTKPFEEATAYVVMRSITLALKRVHLRQILHLDLKEANILITYEKQNEKLLECAELPVSFVLADFGVSKDVTITRPHELVTYHRGTLKYMSPEQNIMEPVKDIFKVEVFQLGVILFRLIYKAYPFQQSSHEDQESRNVNFIEDFEKSARNMHRVNGSDNLKILLKGMLAFRQEDRFSIDQVIGSDWFYEQKTKLYKDQEVLKRTYKQMMQKLGYLMNLTKIKLDITELKRKKTAEDDSKLKSLEQALLTS